MLRIIIIAFCLIGGASLADATGSGSGAAQLDTPVLIVDRRAESISLYFSLPATDLAPTFGIGADDLLDAEGTVDIDRLYDGTYELADRIFASVGAEAEGQQLPFEAISMMVHDPKVLPEFKSPWDGETSIAICTSPETVDKMGLDSLQAYLGYFAWQVNGLATFSLNFPATENGLSKLEVREYWNLQHTGTRSVTLDNTRQLVLKAGDGGGLGAATLWVLAGALASIGLLFLILYARSRKAVSPGTI